MATIIEFDIDLLREVRNAIDAKRVNMQVWTETPGEMFSRPLARTLMKPECNTVGCLAGWITAVTCEYDTAGRRVESVALQQLTSHVTWPYRDHIARHLFRRDHWPKPWHSNGQPDGEALIELLDALIAKRVQLTSTGWVYDEQVPSPSDRMERDRAPRY